MAKRKVTSLPVTELTVEPTNCYIGRDNADINRVVIHSIVGTIKSANIVFNTFYQNRNARRSTNYGVGLDGKIYHWVDEDNTAFANSNWQVNLGAISIEHEDNSNPYDTVRTNAQYEASSRLVHDICKYYGLPIDRTTVIKHKEVPGAATACPAGLDIDRIVKMAAAIDAPIEKPTMIVTQEQNTINVTKASNFDTVANYFGLNEEAKRQPKAGDWVVDRYKQVQTAYFTLKELVDTGKLVSASSKAPQFVPPPSPAVESPSPQSVSIWSKEVSDIADAFKTSLLSVFSKGVSK